MRFSEKIIKFIREGFDTLLYFLIMAVKEDFRNHVGKAGAMDMNPTQRLAILGNGPSLKTQLPQLIAQREWEKADIMAVNFFALSEEFATVKPKYYLLSDPMFFRKAGYSERIAALYNALAKVSWPMTLYVQYYNPERFDYAAAIEGNHYIRIVPFHSTVFHGFRSVEFWCYRHGLGSGNWGTVVQNGILTGIQTGYKTIELYGVDHTLLEGIMVDDNNRLCRTASHYYDSAQAEPKPIYYNATNPPRPYTMAEYLAETAELFRGHEVLRDFAVEQGVRIVNRTAGSLIDAYERQPMK